jgi:hypothetical protein
MGLAVASVLLLKGAAVWIVLQLGIEGLVSSAPWLLPTSRAPRLIAVAKFMKRVNGFVVDAAVTFCALLVLLPSFVFIVLEVFGYVRQRTRAIQAKTLPEYVARGVGVLQGLEIMGERLREVALGLTADLEETMVSGLFQHYSLAFTDASSTSRRKSLVSPNLRLHLKSVGTFFLQCANIARA